MDPGQVDHSSPIIEDGLSSECDHLGEELVTETGPSGKADALMIELHGDHRPPHVLLAHKLGDRHADVLVVRRSRGESADGRDQAPVEALRSSRHADDGDPLVLGDIRIGPTGQPDIVRIVCARGVDLGSVDHKLIAIADGLGLQIRQVRSGLRLGVANGEVDLA